MNWTEQSKTILSCGMPLEEKGINNWALTRDQALKALNKFKNINIPVLGGDVGEIDSNGDFILNYDNWYCDRKANEGLEKYIVRSINESRKYINNYHIDNALFVLVPSSDEGV